MKNLGFSSVWIESLERISMTRDPLVIIVVIIVSIIMMIVGICFLLCYVGRGRGGPCHYQDDTFRFFVI